MAGPEIRVLGPLQLTLDGRELPLGTPMQRAVLGRLVVAHGQAVSTERLVDDLWAGSPPPKAASVLQVHIHSLRRLFEPDRPRRAPSRFIWSESSGYALRIPENSVDAWHFEQRLRTYQELVSNPETRPDTAQRNSLLDALLARWHGPALEAFADAEWAIAEADRLTDLHLTAVELSAQAKLELGRSGEVVIDLRPHFETHPGREELVRLLALAQYALGRQLEALTTIRRSRDFLGGEFGVDPGPALRNLETAILNHAVDLTPALPKPARPPGGALVAAMGGGIAPAPGTPRSTGYFAELSELLTIADTARGGQLRLAWLSGEAGMGKTTLAETVLAALEAADWTVAAGACPDIDGAPPAWAWSEILAALGKANGSEPSGTPSARPAREVSSTVPHLDAGRTIPNWDISGAIPSRDIGRAGASRYAGGVGGSRDISGAGELPPSGAEPFLLSQGLAQWCRRATASGPVALLLENVHRADTATLQVLRQLAVWLRDEPVFLLVTARRSEARPEVTATGAALAQYATAWMDLRGLDPEGTRQVALDAGLTTVDDELLRPLHERTGGNPLFVRELAKLVAAQGSPTAGVPDAVRGFVEDRLARLPAGITDVLQQVSVWGNGAELGLVSMACGLEEDRLIDLIAAAEAAGLVRTGRGGSIVFAHGIVRDAVYLGIPSLRRGRMHWAALELLVWNRDAYPVPARDPEVLARHAMLGASAETAPDAIEYVHAAARRRMERGMRRETARLMRATVELHELAGHATEHAARADRIALLDARCGLVTALAYDNRDRDARTELGLAVALATELGGDELLARALTSWQAPVLWPIRAYREPNEPIRQALSRLLSKNLPTGTGRAPAETSRAEQELTVPRATLVRLLVAATFETELDEYDTAQRLARLALDLAREVGEPELLCAAINAVTFWESDYGPEFAGLVTQLELTAHRAGLPEYRALAHYLGYRAALAHADLRRAGRLVRLAMECAGEGQLQPLLDMDSCCAAMMELLRGDIDLAERLYDRFAVRITLAGKANEVETRLFCAIALGWARGDLSRLVDVLTKNWASLPGVATEPYALALLHAGQEDRARTVFAGLGPVGSGSFPAFRAAMRAQVALELGDRDSMRELLEYLSVHSGTIIGIETGVAAFGPMDSVLATLSDALGDTVGASRYREQAQLLLARIRADLPDTGHALLRAA
ncbi:BTAD domain-containing putative transcriptional regulator [Nocardia huaxiensis]|uniref:AAA family ATPase n=1 Tax=Nocardia huaxiensis TaxID=2755382 RepID=A0A7D6VIX6_9NOCA|nr:BTAD domain-containing putative transcriptional regulator [Nocardia huaxiensis]QLY30610.1 AAA family ATPase [Nocardia huaxiensis]UFS95785.1 AAA family ATPase [Nocardia huaxiensis]